MGMSIKSSAMRGMDKVGSNLRMSAHAAATGKKSIAKLSPVDLSQASVLTKDISAFGGAVNNISITSGKLDIMSSAISNQLELVYNAYNLAVEVTTDITLTAADRTALDLQYQRMLAGDLDAIANGAKDITGTALNNTTVVAVTGATPAADHIDLAAINTLTAVLFAAPAAGVSAGPVGDITSTTNAATAKTVLSLAIGILSGHLEKISQYRTLISQKSDSLGDTIDDMESKLSDIRDADPIAQAQEINDAEQRIMMLGSLFASDSKEKDMITRAAREILAL